MADGTNIIPLRSSREVAWKSSLRIVEGHPQANAGSYGFPDPDAPRIDQDGGRVLIDGRLYRTFMSETNATRVAAALQTLAELGCELPQPPAPAAA